MRVVLENLKAVLQTHALKISAHIDRGRVNRSACGLCERGPPLLLTELYLKTNYFLLFIRSYVTAISRGSAFFWTKNNNKKKSTVYSLRLLNYIKWWCGMVLAYRQHLSLRSVRPFKIGTISFFMKMTILFDYP